MANLLVQSAQMPLPIDLSALGPITLSNQQFYEFCRTNPELRIERNASEEIIVMPPAFADTGNQNSRALGSFLSGLKPMGLEKSTPRTVWQS